MAKVYTLAYFRRQGKLGGLARAAKLTEVRRKEIAQLARQAQLKARDSLKAS